MVAVAPFWIAHRGGAGLAAENTLAACEQAWRAGFRGFEFDLKLSRDGVAFVLHDDDLQRTTAVCGRASHLDWAGLQRRVDPCLPSLADLAAWCAQHPSWFNLEIKPDADADVPTQLRWGAVIAEQVSRCWSGPTPLLSSFSIPALQGAAAAAPQLPRAWLVPRLPAGWLGCAQALGLAAIHLDADGATAAELDAVHAAGYRLRLYTVDDPVQASSWRRLGADGLFCDRWLDQP